MSKQFSSDIQRAHSIYLTGDTSGKPLELPWKILSNINSLKNNHPKFHHELYSDENLREFIRQKFDNKTLAAYDDLTPLSYKADLGRYCLLYEFGGVYSDVSLHFFKGLDDKIIDCKKMLLFRDSFNHAPWIVSNSLIFAQQKLALFEYIIRKIAEHTHKNYYGHNPLCPTGPNLFGRIIAQQMDMHEFVTGDVIKINKAPTTHSYAYILPDGEVCAVNIKTGSGLSSLGAKQNDDYNVHYQNKTIYRSHLINNNIDSRKTGLNFFKNFFRGL